jgi:hypothetical protein
LRKSLAWDRAFFTEQGILVPFFHQWIVKIEIRLVLLIIIANY